jgi:hypothetical protein
VLSKGRGSELRDGLARVRDTVLVQPWADAHGGVPSSTGVCRLWRGLPTASVGMDWSVCVRGASWLCVVNLSSPALGPRSHASGRHASILLPAFHHPTLTFQRQPRSPDRIMTSPDCFVYFSPGVLFDNPRKLAMAPHGLSRSNQLTISSRSHTNRAHPTEHIRLQRNNLKHALLPEAGASRPSHTMPMPMSSSLHLAAGPDEHK